jgi:hypothetical protein
MGVAYIAPVEGVETSPAEAGAARAMAAAERLAEEVLFPAALATDSADIVPNELLDALAEAGLYGLFAAPDVGGLGLDRATGEAIIETLAGACLTTTFVWMQHLSTAVAVADTRLPVHSEWARPLATGAKRSGIAFSHLRHPGPPSIVATKVEDGYVVDGVAPLVTGWGLIDVVHVATRMGDDIAWLLIDATGSETLVPKRLELAAVNASATVSLRAWRHFVPSTRLTTMQPLDDWLEKDALGLRTNGHLSLGVARRCLSLLGPSPLDDQLASTRRALLEAAPGELPDARAAASLFALDAATALMASGGGGSVVRQAHGQRLGREALFLLVQGQTPAIRAAQLALLRLPRIAK